MAMGQSEGSQPADFFKAAHDHFARILAAGRGHSALIETVATEAFDLFERNLAMEAWQQEMLACHKGCPACCCLRVTATAPEIFLLADYIRRIADTEAGARLDLPGRIAEADAAARGLDPQHRMAAQCFCPLMLRDSCIIHPVRPLACRGHASFDKAACTDAAAGRSVDVPLSSAHAFVRSLVQNALQAALRAGGYAWRSYELIQGLHLALSQGGCEAAWKERRDSLAPALITDTDWDALASLFDELIATSRPA